MSHQADAAVAVAFLVVILAGIVAYRVHVHRVGVNRSARIDSAGRAPFIGKGSMEMGSWWMSPIAHGFVRAGITANALSWAALALGVIAGICLANGVLGVACVVATAAAFLDTLDGMVARIDGSSSAAGEVLDTSIDRYAETFFFVGLVVFYQGNLALQLLTIAAFSGAFMVSYTTAKAEALGVDAPVGVMRRPERCVYLCVSTGLSAMTIPLWENSHGSGHPIGIPLVAGLAVIAMASHASTLYRLRAIARLTRARDAVTSGAADQQGHRVGA